MRQRLKTDVPPKYASGDVFANMDMSEVLLVCAFCPHAVHGRSLFNQLKSEREKSFNKVVDSSDEKKKKLKDVEFINYRKRGEKY